MTAELILKDLNNGVLWLTLNNEKQRNPLSSQMLSTMTSTLDEAYDDDAVRCIVISAKGPVFSAGHDLGEMARGEDETKEEWRPRVLSVLEACATMMQRIVHGPKAVIACVQGTATAAGCGGGSGDRTSLTIHSGRELRSFQALARAGLKLLRSAVHKGTLPTLALVCHKRYISKTK